jgi:hypothetical protein
MNPRPPCLPPPGLRPSHWLHYTAEICGWLHRADGRWVLTWSDLDPGTHGEVLPDTDYVHIALESGAPYRHLYRYHTCPRRSLNEIPSDGL